jgi:hypothetical protein
VRTNKQLVLKVLIHLRSLFAHRMVILHDLHILKLTCVLGCLAIFKVHLVILIINVVIYFRLIS